MTRLSYWEPGELYDHEFPQEQFICDPLVPSGGITLIHGPTTVGKTRLGLTLALAIATGEPFLARFNCAQSKVLYIQADMPNSLYHPRIRSIPPLKGPRIPICHLMTDGDVLDVIAEAERPSELVQRAREAQPSVVFVDTVSKVHWLSGNDDATPKIVYSALRALFSGAAFVFLHHDRKAAQTGWQTSRSQDESAKGDTGWRDNADGIIHMISQSAEADDSDIRVRLKFTKTRGDAIPAPVTVLGDLNTLLMRPTSVGDAQIAHWLSEGLTEPEMVARLMEFGLSRATAYRRVRKTRSDEEMA